MAFFPNLANQFSSLAQLPSALLQKRRAEQQASALGSATRTATPFQPVITQQSVGSLGSFPTPTFQSPQNDYQSQLDALTKTTQGLQSQVTGFQQPQGLTPEQVQERIRQEEVFNRYRTLAGQFAESQKMTPEETAAQEQLNALNASYGLGLTDIQNKPIALNFITGQQAALERRAGALAQPLTSRLALLQQQREGQQKALESQLGFAESALGRAEKATRPDETEISEFVNEKGERIVVFKDKRTGKIRQEVVGKEAVKEEKLGTQVTDIGGRRVLINTQTGQVIKDLGVSPVTTTGEERTQETKTQAAISLYGQTLQDAINAGATPAEAVQVASTIAKNQGTTLSLLEQNALLKHTQTLKKTVPEQPAQTQQKGFFSRLFGL